MTQITIHPRAGIVARISAWVRRRQRDLSDRVHAAADERARRYGWEITESTGRLGFSARTYRDPRFDGRRRQLSPGAARLTGRDHCEASLEVNRPVCGPDAAPYVSPEKDAVLAEWPGAPRAETRPAEDQIIGWHETNECRNEADNYQPGGEAGK
jgi:hypothetical protein